MKSLTFFFLLSLSFTFSYSLSAKKHIPTPIINCDDITLEIEISPAYAVLSCNIEEVILQVTGSSSNGAYTVEWIGQTGQSVLIITEPGIYTAIITDTNSGCTATSISQVDYLDNTPLANAGPDKEISCISPCTMLQPNPGSSTGVVSFAWTGPDSFYSPELYPIVCNPGEYILSIHEELGGCTFYYSTQVIEVYENVITDYAAQVCPGGCFNFAGVEYCEIGTYQIPFNNWQGCDSIVHLQLSLLDVAASILSPETLTCQQEQIILDGGSSQLPSGASFAWTSPNGHFVDTPNSLTPTVDGPGLYILQISTGPDCQVLDSVVVVADQVSPLANADSDTQLDCPNNIANINGAVDSLLSDFDLSWSGPNNFFSTQLQNQVSNVGLYTLKVTNLQNGCNTEDDMYVAPPEEVNVALTTETTCWNDSKGQINIAILDGGLAPYSFSIDGQNYQPDSDFQQLASGAYTVYWKDALECGGQADIVIPEIPAIETNVEEVYHICGDGYTTLNAAVDLNELQTAVHYKWNDGSTGPVMRTNLAGQYWVEITDECEILRQEVEVINDYIPAEQNVYVPTAFSPNNDLVNDIFKPYLNHDLIHYEIHIYDRRGSQMFFSENPIEGWDGTLKGKNAPAGVYAYWIEYVITTCGGGRDHGFLKGDLTLFR